MLNGIMVSSAATNEFIVKIKLCSELSDCIQLICENLTDADGVPSGVRDALKNSDNPDYSISISDFKWLYSKLTPEKKRSVYKYIRVNDIVLPAPQMLPRNPELQARIEKLKLIAAEQEYRTMTKNVDTSRVKQPEDTISSQLREMNRQLIAVLQVIVSISAGFAFGFNGVEYIVGRLSEQTRIFLGLSCAGIIMIAEMYFLIKKIDFDEKSIDTAKKSVTIRELNGGVNHQEATIAEHSSEHHSHKE